jgi:LacI family transcriptional regulator
VQTMRDIAVALGLHKSTVSRAMDPKKQHLVAHGTRERILSAARAAGYTPDAAAAGLRKRQTSSVGILVPDLDNRSIIRVVRAITAALEQDDYVALVAESMDDSARVTRVLEQFRARRVDAVVTLAATQADRRELEELAQLVPVILAVRRLGRSRLPTVACDDALGGRLVARHLAALGHRHVAQICGPPTVQTFRDRARGFERTCRAQGIEVYGVHADHATIAEGSRVASTVTQLTGVSAIFAHNDDMALGVLQSIREQGLRCPGDISLVGYNDTEIGRQVTPALTTMTWPAEDVGRTAAQVALAAIEGRLGSPSPRIYRPVLVVRDSTAPRPSGASTRRQASAHRCPSSLDGVGPPGVK